MQAQNEQNAIDQPSERHPLITYVTKRFRATARTLAHALSRQPVIRFLAAIGSLPRSLGGCRGGVRTILIISNPKPPSCDAAAQLIKNDPELAQLQLLTASGNKPEETKISKADPGDFTTQETATLLTAPAKPEVKRAKLIGTPIAASQHKGDKAYVGVANDTQLVRPPCRSACVPSAATTTIAATTEHHNSPSNNPKQPPIHPPVQSDAEATRLALLEALARKAISCLTPDELLMLCAEAASQDDAPPSLSGVTAH
jgi:hypothetical protein